MRKLVVAVCVVLVPFLAFAQQDFSKVEIKVQKVAGTVYMLQGAGGNIGVSVGDDGIVMVDDQFAPLAPKIQAALKSITDKQLRFVLNTHWHGDHTGGNPIFSQQAPIIAQENVRKRLAEGRKTPAPEIPPQPRNVLPVITFQDKVSVHLNGEDIQAIHFPRGHTDGDSVIFFPQSNVLHMGDDFVTYGFPFVDLNSGGSVSGMIDALHKVVALVPADVKVIPGHGNLSTLDDVRSFTKMVEDTFNLVSDQVKQGKTADQIKQGNVLAAYSKYSGSFVSTDKWIDTIYAELKGSGQ
jgi:glyoxylase-like metal-dependent hydrolase (beta-lactamase superfamily II)